MQSKMGKWLPLEGIETKHNIGACGVPNFTDWNSNNKRLLRKNLICSSVVLSSGTFWTSWSEIIEIPKVEEVTNSFTAELEPQKLKHKSLISIA